jgi:hypothetical protein
MQREIMRAGEKAQQVAYAELRVQVRMELGAPSEPSRGTGDCLALVLMPLGLVLMLVHPAPPPSPSGRWRVAWVLAGSNQMKRDRAASQASDDEAERRWRRQQLLAARIEEEKGPLTAPRRPPVPPQPAGSAPQHPG